MEAWTNDIKEFVQDTNDLLSNRQFAELFGCAASTVSWLRCQWGLKKMEMEYWTPEMVQWLIQLYTTIGDKELAQIFEEAFPKNKPWTLKHIEKKRNYLGLHRTKQQLKGIKERNKLFGCWLVGSERAWATRGKAAEGTIKEWGGRPYIKLKKGYAPAPRHIWETTFGPIPKGMNIVVKNPAAPLTLANLEMLSDAELASRNSFHRYPLELKRAIIALNKLDKTTLQKQKTLQHG